jgi:phosphoglycolate phosphatase-like HAD superfamily hydrolase
MATMLGSLLVSLGLESGAFKSGLAGAEKELARAQKRIEKVGEGMVDFGTKMSMAVTVPMIGLIQQSIKGFKDQEAAMAQVNAALASMGNASGKTAAELAKTADALETKSLFDADVILKQVTANLLTFGNVAGEQFDRAQQAALDMATRLGGEPQAAAIMLGKALNDPIKGISALTRVGVQFTEAQKSQIQAMAQAGDMAGAQGIILAEVEKQFRGAAQAAADVTPWRAAQVAIGQAMDAIGKAALPAVKAIAEAVKSAALAFAELPEPVQKGAVYVGMLVAAIGPLAMAIGAVTSALAPFIAGLLRLLRLAARSWGWDLQSVGCGYRRGHYCPCLDGSAGCVCR